MEHFMVTFKVLNTLASSFPANVYFHSPVTAILHSSWTNSLSRILPTHTSGSRSSLTLGVGQAVLLFPPSISNNTTHCSVL